MPTRRRGHQRHRRDRQDYSEESVELPYLSYELVKVVYYFRYRHIVECVAAGVELASHSTGTGRKHGPVCPRHPRFGQPGREDKHGRLLKCLPHAIEVLAPQQVEIERRTRAITLTRIV